MVECYRRLADLLPLDWGRHGYRDPFPSGETDPDSGVVADGSRPLVLYAVDAEVTLLLAKRGDDIRVVF